MTKKKKQRSVIVVVTESRYDIFGEANSFWSSYLKTLIESKGGINESVKPGIYSFRLERRGFKIYSILEPWIKF